MKAYLAGKITKGSEASTNWRYTWEKVLSEISISVLSPENDNLDEGNAQHVVGHGCVAIRDSDLIIVDASSKVGAGTAQEMIIAKYYRKPVVTVIPPETHHRRRNLRIGNQIVADWIHPFLFTSSDAVISSIDELRDIDLANLTKSAGGLEYIDTVVKAYEESLNQEKLQR